MIRAFSSTLLVAAFAVACSSASGPSLDPTHTNCNDVCQKAHDCGSSSTNVSSCTDNCVKKSSSTSYKDNVQTCADCVQPKSCSDAAQCVGDCFNLVLSS
jgi:hypothetical protein